MDVQQIHRALDRIFNEEKARIVFWDDAEGDAAANRPLDLGRSIPALDAGKQER